MSQFTSCPIVSYDYWFLSDIAHIHILLAFHWYWYCWYCYIFVCLGVEMVKMHQRQPFVTFIVKQLPVAC